MASIILVVFLVQLSLSLISTFGVQTINDIAWWAFTRLPTDEGKQAEANTKLRNEVVRLQREIAGVSAQDNFAKWARLRRDHDKAKEKYEKAAQAHQSFRSSFDSIISTLRWLSTQGLNFFLNTWFAKQPMFWLPQGWLPHRAEWLLSCPRAPLGSISVNVWAIACGSVIGMLIQGMVALWTLRTGEVKTGVNKGEKLKAQTTVSEQKERKKEL